MCVLAAAVVLRLLWHDGTILLVWANSFTRYLYLPGYATLLVGLWLRRKSLAVVSLLIVVVQGVWMAPLLPVPSWSRASRSREHRALDGASVRLYFHNVWRFNRNLSETLGEIESVDPDVVVLAEYTRNLHDAVKADPELARFPYRTTPGGNFSGQVVLYSKLPIVSYRRQWSDNRLALDVELELTSERRLRLIALHAPRPLYRHADQWQRYWDRVFDIIGDVSVPTVIVGDFNLTPHSLRYAQLLDLGLRDAFLIDGNGLQTTWPTQGWWLPSIRIDQLLVSEQVECNAIQVGQDRSSDHRPIIADLQVRASVHD